MVYDNATGGSITLGNSGTSTISSFIYDTTAPTFTFANASANECTTGTLTIAGYSDGAGAGVNTTSGFSFDGTTWANTTALTIPLQRTAGVQTRTGRVRDRLGNNGYITSTFTFTNIIPTVTTSTYTYSTIVAPTSGNKSVGNVVTLLGANE